MEIERIDYRNQLSDELVTESIINEHDNDTNSSILNHLGIEDENEEKNNFLIKEDKND